MRDIKKYEVEYAVSDFEQMYQVRYRRKKILEFLDSGEYRRILEVGCGMQSIGSFIQDFDEFTIVEPGSMFIERAKKDLADKSGICFVEGFLEEQIKVLKEKKFDFIIVSSLLHELERPLGLLHAVRDLCTEGQTVVHINVPNSHSLHRILAYESGLIQSVSSKSDRNVQLQQNHVFDLEALAEVVRSSGDVLIMDKGSYFVKPFSHEQMEKCLNEKIFDERIFDGFYNLIKYIPEMGSEIYINYKYL